MLVRLKNSICFIIRTIDTKKLTEFLAQWGVKPDTERTPRNRKSPLHVLDIADINLYKLIVKEPELLKSFRLENF